MIKLSGKLLMDLRQNIYIHHPDGEDEFLVDVLFDADLIDKQVEIVIKEAE